MITPDNDSVITDIEIAAPPMQRTVVRWELTPIATGTRVTVTHSGLAKLDQPRKDYSQGWPGLLAAIRQYVEKQ